MSSDSPGPAARGRRRLGGALWRWGPAVLYIALVFTVSSIPIHNAPSIWKYQDKLAHFAEYSVLAALLLRAMAPAGRFRSAAGAFLLAVFLAAVDELHQALVPGRSPDFKDAVADAVGALLGVLVALPLLALFGRRARAQAARGGEPGEQPQTNTDLRV